VRARELADPDFPRVTLSTSALTAARLLLESRRHGLLVLDEQGAPHAVLPIGPLLRKTVPEYVLEDPRLAAVVDETHADRLGARLAGLTVGDCLPDARHAPPVARPDDTLLAVAALITASSCPLVAVVDRGPGPAGDRLLGVISQRHLLDHLVRAAS
jgi:CBS domain-containing protein